MKPSLTSLPSLRQLILETIDDFAAKEDISALEQLGLARLRKRLAQTEDAIEISRRWTMGVVR